MVSSRAPIAVFAYNRLDHFERMFTSLRTCHGFEESEVTIFIDGPKSEKEAPQVQAVRDFAASIHLPNVHVVLNKKNKGLKASIFKGVTEICRKEGRVIVLEDDLLFSPVLLDYFNKALETYKDSPSVWSVVGYQYDVPALRSCDRALVLPFTHAWGWATWERAWCQFSMADPVDPKDLASSSFAKAFDVFGIRDYKNLMVLSLAKIINCWSICWYYKIFHERGVSIFPPRSYVIHGGYDGGTHASCLNPYTLLVKRAAVSTTPCKMPTSLRVDYWAIDLIRKSWDARVQITISHLGRFKRHFLRRFYLGRGAIHSVWQACKIRRRQAGSEATKRSR